MPNNTVPDGPISDRTLAALRTTAAVLAAVPNVAAEIRAGEHVVLEVRRPPLPAADHRIMPVCVFHTAVAGAHRMRRSGERVGMRGAPVDAEPSIAWGISGPGAVLPGGMLRLERGDRWWHVAAVPHPREVVVAAIGPQPADVGIHGDEDLDVTIVHGTTPAGDHRAAAAAVDRLVHVIASAGAADLEHRLAVHAG